MSHENEDRISEVAQTRFLCRYPHIDAHPRTSDVAANPCDRPQSLSFRAFSSIRLTASHARGRWFETSRAHGQ
jgi:hypothetical protein